MFLCLVTVVGDPSRNASIALVLLSPPPVTPYSLSVRFLSYGVLSLQKRHGIAWYSGSRIPQRSVLVRGALLRARSLPAFCQVLIFWSGAGGQGVSLIYTLTVRGDGYGWRSGKHIADSKVRSVKASSFKDSKRTRRTRPTQTR